MKKFTLFVALVLLSSAASMAQARFGVRGGLSISNSSFSSKGGITSNSITGYHGGILFEGQIAPLLSIQPEILFDQRGSKITGSGFETSLLTNYAVIPIFLKLTIPLTKDFNVNAHVGPYAGLALGGKSKDSTGKESDVLVVNAYSSNDFAKTQVSLVDLGLTFGAGFSINVIAGIAIFIDGRYSIGFTEIQKYGDGTPTSAGFASAIRDYEKSSNRALQLSAGVSFKIGD